MPRARNVVLFGECGVGKSSLINAIAGRPLAQTNNDVLGCTVENVSYNVTLDESGIEIRLWDTIGLDEGTAGNIPAGKARQRLKEFLKAQIAKPDGLDLLLYCFRGASGTKSLPIKRVHWDNYAFVFEQVCKKRVPMAIIVTNLECYDPGGDMDAWWKDNSERLSGFGFQFCAHARINASRRKLRDLLSYNFLSPRNILLTGVRHDRNDFIYMTSGLRQKQAARKAEVISPFTCVPLEFDSHSHVNLWDTRQFDETEDETFVTEKNLKLLVQGMNQISGVDLLLFCFRAGRPKACHVRNYTLFHAAICRKKVPVVIVVLGLETEADTWWERNKLDLKQKGLRFDGHIYIPCDPCQQSDIPLTDAICRRFVDLVQQEYTSSSGWTICNDAFWVTVPNVRAVVGELSWPTTTVIVCDATKDDALGHIAPGVESSLQCTVSGAQREHRFQQVDARSISTGPTANQLSGNVQSLAPGQGNKGVSLLLFLMSASDLQSETWSILEKFYTLYNGSITPCLIVIHGVPDRRLAEDIWKVAPRRIKRHIGAHTTYYPGPNASPNAHTIARETMVDMIQGLSLMDLGEKVGVLREILSIWRRYRSQRSRPSDVPRQL